MNELDRLPKNRRKRVNRIKKLIVGSIILTLLIPIIICIILGVRLDRMNHNLQSADETIATLKAEVEHLSSVVTQINESSENIVVEENEASDETIDDGKKSVYLTFDDGPSANTSAILDILDSYNVKATFFVIGNTTKEGEDLYKRIVEDGHSIGVHSYSHIYSEIYRSYDAYFADFDKMSDYVYEVTNVRPSICRLPGGSSNKVSKIDMTELVKQLNDKNILCYDWNVAGKDADKSGRSAQDICDNVLSGIEKHDSSVVLLHDGADKQNTVQALSMILEKLAGREDIKILPITNDTPVVLHVSH